MDYSELKRLAEAANEDCKRYLTNFFAKVEITDHCWIWKASTSGRKGGGMYGCFWNGKIIKAHRFSYEAWHGPIPEGKVICHKCDNPLCVNPAHLYAGTTSQNIRDAVDRGLHSNGQLKKEFCANGHPYIESNTYVNKKGHRYCRTCANIHRGRAPKNYF